MKHKQFPRAAGLAVLALAAILILGMGGVPCPIRTVTGVSCPGCGMTRACVCALRLDLAAAFRYHPLWPMAPLLAAVYLGQRRLPPRLVQAAMAAALILLLAVYLMRMADPTDPVVTFQPEEGWIGRAILALCSR